jgi:hypothetical protein
MSKLLTALLAAGFGLGLNAAPAQDVKSDQTRAQQQEQLMQQKEQGANRSAVGDRDRATTTDGRTRTDNSSAQSDQHSASQGAAQDQSKEQIPQQSMPSVGHPREGAATGQFGVKKYNEQESGQSGTESR